MIFYNFTNSRVLISNMIISFQISAQKYPNHTIFVPNLDIFVFSQNLLLDKFEGANFKYETVFFKFQPKNAQIRHFWSQIQGFLFCTKLCNQTNLRALISNMTMAFSNSSPKIPKSSIFCPKCKYFLILHAASHIEKFEVTD